MYGRTIDESECCSDSCAIFGIFGYMKTYTVHLFKLRECILALRQLSEISNQYKIFDGTVQGGKNRRLADVLQYHAAVVARGMGKCCVSGAGALEIDYKNKVAIVDGVILREGDFISLNGTTGEAYVGQVETRAAELSADFAEVMKLADKYTKLQVRTNADTPHVG